MWVLWEVNLLSGEYKILGVTKEKSSVIRVAAELTVKNPNIYYRFNEVIEFD